MKLRIFGGIKKYADGRPVRLHMPAHKGKGLDALTGFYDITELNAVRNEELLNKAGEDIARIVGAPFCIILTDGATCGILSAIKVGAAFGKKAIINRTAHKSVYNALALLSVEPVIIDAITPRAVETALNENPDSFGAVLTYPDYYGRAFDIAGVAEVLRRKDKLFIADDAHGAHFAFSDAEKYVGKYADIWIDGNHKNLYSLNQGATVFCREKYAPALKEAVGVFSTTSPSYLIAASVEYGVKYVAKKGRKILNGTLKKRVSDFKDFALKNGLKVLDNDDFLKVSVNFADSGINPYKAEKILESAGIFAELNDGKSLLFMFSANNSTEDFRRLKRAIKACAELKRDYTYKDREVTRVKRTDYLFAINSESEEIAVKDAVGRVSAVNAGFFPPCSPIIVAGEEITAEIADLLCRGKSVFGINHGKIKVVKNER